ncbi:MAG: Peptidylprolyl isomerase [Frankiales bacterium]|jgi:hypothetical protein|nr:Peptidylprolyl isomerase [Frankiales bacterium]
MMRTLVVALALTSALTACGSSDKPTAKVAAGGSPSPSPTASASCTPSGSGTKDLATKPVYTVPSAPPPTVTTVTDIVCGTGEAAADGSAVEVRYLGVDYKTGAEFDSTWKESAAATYQFSVGSGVIPGFSKGVLGMQPGGRRLVVIPPADGYGDRGPVPGGTLAFVIDLVKIG